MQILGLKTINYGTLVCDKHFRPEDYVGGKKKRLAMPSLYLDLEMKQEVGDQVSEQVNVEMTAQQEIVVRFFELIKVFKGLFHINLSEYFRICLSSLPGK